MCQTNEIERKPSIDEIIEDAKKRADAQEAKPKKPKDEGPIIERTR